MSVRVQVVLDEDERDRFRRQAKREGLSLSAWLRQAAIQKVAVEDRRRISSVEDLRDFFRERGAEEQGREPDWEEHLAVIRRSRQAGADS